MNETKRLHTPAPWIWYRDGSGHPLLCTPDRGMLTVMDFAEPRFALWTGLEDGADRGRLGGVMRNAIASRISRRLRATALLTIPNSAHGPTLDKTIRARRRLYRGLKQRYVANRIEYVRATEKATRRAERMLRRAGARAISGVTLRSEKRDDVESPAPAPVVEEAA